MGPLKYLYSFWRTLEIALINCESNLILIFSANCLTLSSAPANRVTIFLITDEKRYVVTM